MKQSIFSPSARLTKVHRKNAIAVIEGCDDCSSIVCQDLISKRQVRSEIIVIVNSFNNGSVSTVEAEEQIIDAQFVACAR